MPDAPFTCRPARLEDEPSLRALIEASLVELQRPFLDAEQLIACRELMGLDLQVIADGTYIVAEAADGRLAGCGGWSRRAAIYGGEHTPARDISLLDPQRDPARIRAVYTHPAFARRGIGRLILSHAEAGAGAAGFTSVEALATLAGRELFSRCGYGNDQPVLETRDGVAIPFFRMSKTLERASTRAE